MQSIRTYKTLSRLNGFRRPTPFNTFKNYISKRKFADPSKEGDWRLNEPNNKYIFYNFARLKRTPTFIPAVCVFFDAYVFRSNTTMAMFIIFLGWSFERSCERITDWWWYKQNRGRMFEPEVLDKFPPEMEEEEDDDDDDW